MSVMPLLLDVYLLIIFSANIGGFVKQEYYKIFAIPLNTHVDLFSYTNLYNFKRKSGEYISRTLIFERKFLGYYICMTSDARYEVVLIGLDKPLKFEMVPPNIEGGVVGDVVSFTCSVSFETSHEVRVNGLLRIHKTRRLREHVKASKVLGGPHELKTDLSFNLTKPGTEVFKCSFEYDTLFDAKDGDYDVDFKSPNADVVNISIPVYMAPQEVIPNSTIVKINEAVECSSVSIPPESQHEWTCEGTGWTSEGRILRIVKGGKHLCTCVASQTILNKPYKAEWNGQIFAGGDLLTMNPKLVLSLVIGCKWF